MQLGHEVGEERGEMREDRGEKGEEKEGVGIREGNLGM